MQFECAAAHVFGLRAEIAKIAGLRRPWCLRSQRNIRSCAVDSVTAPCSVSVAIRVS